MTTNQFFNEELYLAKNPKVASSVTSGKYASGYDEFIQVGQFVERNGVIFNGTNRNDTVQASGQKSSVIGVNVETAEVGNRLINAETSSLGVDEIDILLGSPGRNLFYLGDNAAEKPIVQSIQFQPNSYLLASASADGMVCLWNKGRKLTQFLDGADGGLSCLSWHPQGHQFAVGGNNGELIIWSKGMRGQGFGRDDF
ncbi:MAG: hypothetical protein KME60_01580 [Cyanomargarita calcarea GSE-NOS-MK-12-04C]|jgi:WD40 repeat protein|uniref:Uncharacterized protein n=1 Tax=Cyanomargarita calcarea GSE-NOS-MK-12-04C TaxID=2839659 RepID=A0A951UQZ7_9CYAN|nr:hypothetical protein [Cyanomargarita calcarea GSE-NOS-MK-12-04C]